MGEAIDVRIQAANAVAQTFRQHRNDAIGQINAVATPAGFAIERASQRYISRNVGDVDAETPTPIIVDLFNVDRVVKIARVIGVDGDNEFVAQIVASINHSLLD